MITVYFSPDWDFETFLFQNYRSSNTKKSEALVEYYYCFAHYKF